MSREVFLRCPRLWHAGFEHGFGTRYSQDRAIPRLETVRQVHGTRVLRAPLTVPDAAADALVTDVPGVAVGVFTADCVPILIADRLRRGVAAVHAGWRGSVAEIAVAAVEALRKETGSPPEDLVAVIGPHIRSCCYEVDGPVVSAVREPDALRPSTRPGHQMLDLYALNRRQLERAGVPSRWILHVAACTRCDTRFASYRRDGTAGRMLHYVRMPAPPGAS